MKNKTVKAFCAVAALLMLLGVLVFGASASREVTEGMYTYYISQTGKCIITKGDPALSGDFCAFLENAEQKSSKNRQKQRIFAVFRHSLSKNRKMMYL